VLRINFTGQAKPLLSEQRSFGVFVDVISRLSHLISVKYTR
jgi:hypothetical protein